MRVRTAVAVVLTTAAGAAGASAVVPPAHAAPAWRPAAPAGWDSLGALLPERPGEFAAAGGWLAVTGGDGLLRIAGPAGGAVARPLPRGATDVAFLGPERIVVGAPCAVDRTDDGGRWTRSPLPGCDRDRTSFGPRFVAIDARTALAVGDRRTWRTVDAGATWNLTPARGAEPTAALDADTWLRVTTVGGPADVDQREVVERTRDAGRTWSRLALPDVLRPDGSRGPAGALHTAAAVAVRPGGTLLIGYGRTLFTSTDAGETFVPHDLPPDPAPEPPAGPGPAAEHVPGMIVQIVCDPAAVCVVGAEQFGIRVAADAARLFAGDAFGAAVEPPPERGAASPAPGVIVGLTHAGGDDYKSGPSYDRLERSDDLGRTPYRSAAESYGGGARLWSDGLAVAPDPDGTRLSVDAAATFGAETLPFDTAGTQLLPSPAGTVALTSAGVLWRREAGTWVSRGRLGPLDGPSLVDAGRSGTYVVGRRALRRLGPTGRLDVLRHPSPVGALGRITAVGRGRTLLVTGSRDVRRRDGAPLGYRTTDGGRHWTRLTRRAIARWESLRSVRFVTERVGYARRGATLLRTTDAGARFRPVGVVPVLDTASDRSTDPGERPFGVRDVVFSDRRHGLATTSSGLLHTADGGRRWTPLPAPFGDVPTGAVLRGGRLVLSTDAADGVWRTVVGSWRPAPRLEVDVRPDGRGGRRGFRVTGVLRGASAREHVVLTARRADGRTEPLRRVAAVQGRFGGRVTVPGDARGVRAWYLGSAAPEGTIPGASSDLVALP